MTFLSLAACSDFWYWLRRTNHDGTSDGCSFMPSAAQCLKHHITSPHRESDSTIQRTPFTCTSTHLIKMPHNPSYLDKRLHPDHGRSFNEPLELLQVTEWDGSIFVASASSKEKSGGSCLVHVNNLNAFNHQNTVKRTQVYRRLTSNRTQWMI